METSDSFPAQSAIPVGYGPEGIAVDGQARRGYVACARANSVAVFDLDSREVVTQVPVGREPIGLVHDRDGGRVFSTDARAVVTDLESAPQQPTTGLVRLSGIRPSPISARP